MCVTAQDVAEALRRLPPSVIAARNSRLRRSIDLGTKHSTLHGELLAKQTPADHYLQVGGWSGSAKGLGVGMWVHKPALLPP